MPETALGFVIGIVTSCRIAGEPNHYNGRTVNPANGGCEKGTILDPGACDASSRRTERSKLFLLCATNVTQAVDGSAKPQVDRLLMRVARIPDKDEVRGSSGSSDFSGV
jgi:hypothetical protein